MVVVWTINPETGKRRPRAALCLICDGVGQVHGCGIWWCRQG
jgi:hypothetical protein